MAVLGVVARAEPPRPLITEVLWDVPAGAEGDASGDGVRDAVGDEFVEIHNPFDRAIELEGFVIEDGHPEGDAARWRFEFPPARLEPGQCAVVFNGNGTRVVGPVGDAQRAAGPNPNFGGALVFASGNTSSRVGLANKGDWVILRDAGGRGVHAVVWGEPSVRPPEGVALDEAPAGGGSSALENLEGSFVPHGSLKGGVPCSPGVFP